MKKLLAALLCLAWLPGLAGVHAAAALKSDEQVVLYPAIARQRSGAWEIEAHGIVYEPERQKLLAGVMRRVLGIDEDDLTASERATLRERSRYFLVDNEHGKHLALKIGERTFAMGTSAANGHFQGAFSLGAADLPGVSTNLSDTNLTVRCEIGTPGKPGRIVDLEIQFLHEAGLSVISDIDDTIKISQVRDRDAMIQNTFCRPFKPVPGLAEVYRDWSGHGAQFHYLTASPWQLYLPLSSFVRSNGFPAGTFHMKNFRLKDGSFIGLFKSPESYKPAVIERLLAQFPRRRFVLAGDSGEKDPEIYGDVARRHPGRIVQIYIRAVTDEPADSARYKSAFERVPRGRWQLFKTPAEIRREPVTGAR